MKATVTERRWLEFVVRSPILTGRLQEQGLFRMLECMSLSMMLGLTVLMQYARNVEGAQANLHHARVELALLAFESLLQAVLLQERGGRGVCITDQNSFT